MIGPEDVLDINVWKEPDMTRVVPVRPDGKISLPLINDVQAAGSTPQQLAATVTEKLRKFITEPQVTVIVTQINSQRVFVVGEVLRAGAFPLIPGMTVLQALASAGGFTTFADVKKIHVMRLVNGKHIGIALQLPGSPQGRQSGSKYQAGAGRHSRRPVRGETMKLRNTNWTLVVALVLCATAAFAQDQKQDTSPIDPNAPLQPLDTIPERRDMRINRPSARFAALICPMIPALRSGAGHAGHEYACRSRAVHSRIAAAHAQYFRPHDFGFASRANDPQRNGARRS